MPDLLRIPTWGEDDTLNVVVETPKGSGIKFNYDASIKAIRFDRALALGITYPYDFGFVPSTRAEDGDPLDVLVLTDSSSYPGVVIPTRLLAVVLLSQKSESGKGRERNNRLIAVPARLERFSTITNANLPKRLRAEIEQFFVSTDFFTAKKARIEGWQEEREALRLIKSGKRQFRSHRR